MALRLIAKVMGWPEDDNEIATEEYAWLRFMAAAKYDGYSDFKAGVRFLESLATWLKQFEPDDRKVAYEFVKRRLVYISPPELQCLIEAFVPETVTPRLRENIAEELGVAPWEVWSTAAGGELFAHRLRKTLFVGMSDGSRIDALRRANPGRLLQEQVLPMLNIDDGKWRSLNKDLKAYRAEETFDTVYLIDDFTASGTTFIRKTEGVWSGKLKKFNDLVTKARDGLKAAFPLAENYTLHIHHYISSHQAHGNLTRMMTEAARDWTERTFGDWRVTEGLLLPESLAMSRPADAAMLDLSDKYYDGQLFENYRTHAEEAGMTHYRYGYADCALPIVMDHNTPNNSLSLLWAETHGGEGVHAMRSLFNRRSRHG
ncbi:MAG: hypothetical protein EON59_01930 [Alphaproteobacteria bacterium]|nr:MAG: hypothetical protein EON59_01930 [Alphaproteobacteria bacterium]